MRRKSNTFLAITILTACMHMNVFISVAASMDQSVIRYENKADFVCGPSQDQSEMKTHHEISVNIYNPNDFPVMVNSFLSINSQEHFVAPELNDRYLNVLLSPNRGFSISCKYIENLFFEEMGADQKSQLPFKGYIQSKSIEYLDVAYHYISDSVLKTVSQEEEQNEASENSGVKFITFYSKLI